MHPRFSRIIALGAAALVVAALLAGTASAAAPAPVTFVELTPLFATTPVGIASYEPTNQLLMSATFSTSGGTSDLLRVGSDGFRSDWGSIVGGFDEIHVATVTQSSCTGGFTVGEAFTGTGQAGQVTRTSAAGSSLDPWVTLPGELGAVRSAGYQDAACDLGGALVVTTDTGGVWTITSAGIATKLAQIDDASLEGVLTVPNDARYGPWAGKLLVGAEDERLLYTIAGDGTATAYDIGVAAEDIHLVPAHQNFFAANYSNGHIDGVAAADFADKAGDIVMTEEYNGDLFDVRWNAGSGQFDVTTLASGLGIFEGSTFSAAGLTPLAPAPQSSPTDIACGANTGSFGFTSVSATLTSGGSALAGVQVSFAGAVSGSATTAATGVATLAPAQPVTSGSVTVSFAGDAGHDAASATCAVAVTSSAGKVTAGTLKSPSGRGGFEVASDGTITRGTLEFQTGTQNLHAHAIAALGVSSDGTKAWFAGTLDDGRAFTVYTEDNGEPGRTDVFRLWVGGTEVSGGVGSLAGGNVQIHRA